MRSELPYTSFFSRRPSVLLVKERRAPPRWALDGERWRASIQIICDAQILLGFDLFGRSFAAS